MQKPAMTSRERVLAAARGFPHDRVPVMLWLNPHAASRMMVEYQSSKKWLSNQIVRFLWRRFAASGGMDGPDLWRALPLIVNEFANRDYVAQLGSDMVIQQVGNPVAKTWWENKHIRAQDIFGSVHGMGGIYDYVIKPAISSPKDLKDYRFPYPKDERPFDAVRTLRKARPEACILVETFGVQDLFANYLWEMSEFMMALYDAPEEVRSFQLRFCDWAVDTAVRGVRAGGDVVYIYDDYGYTGHLLISYKMWREFTYPHLKRIIAAVHEAGGIAMLHSCGYQMPLLDSYIEAELDILQAFQPKAGNDFASAYEKYGDQLTFCTGIDTQLGESMTPQEMRKSIVYNYQIGQTKQRHILGMTHMLQYTMPLDNICTIIQTVQEIQTGQI